MALTILVSFSLLALVVSARPVIPSDAPDLINLPESVQHAIQAVFESRVGVECLTCGDGEGEDKVRILLASPAVQHAYLAQLSGLDAVTTALPLGALSDDERQLYTVPSDPSSSHASELTEGPSPAEPPLQGADADLVPPPDVSDSVPAVSPDAASSEIATGGTASSSSQPSLSDLHHTPLIAIAAACVAALLALFCVSVFLYMVHYYRAYVLRSESVWDALPRMEKARVDNATRPSGGRPPCYDDDAKLKPEPPSPALEKDLIEFDGAVELPPPSICEPRGEVADKVDVGSLLLDIPSPQPVRQRIFIDIPADTEKHAFLTPASDLDPALLPLPASPTPFMTPRSLAASPLVRPLSPLQMRERAASPKPAWSLRASASPALGLAALPPRAPSPLPCIPGGLSLEPEAEVPRDVDAQRAHRAPVPELDLAFAMQLRPGLGLGADPAWLVRFLMAMFGWMTVLIGGAPH
ncbi:hypothetical protein WOLCODRAFT_167626 [Wolfiporia cocos MD-104 SS10]|uniref:Uncharacterized protein n=1 Tax=Wolfiporia cocos (strain MD-104) TaxID=742152 RepID=A0A2H3JCS1_WOLCO|nr:hypothetical protein WOLCODRAFT_167626 [Wolfiporia cocos MD-104 SS10]